jgi:hypothetical protein
MSSPLPAAAKHLADVGASASGIFMVASQFCAIATPIVTFLIGIATLAWWALRFWERYAGKTPKSSLLSDLLKD